MAANPKFQMEKTRGRHGREDELSQDSAVAAAAAAEKAGWPTADEGGGRRELAASSRSPHGAPIQSDDFFLPSLIRCSDQLAQDVECHANNNFLVKLVDERKRNLDTQAKPDQVRIHVALAHPLVVGLGCAEQGRRYGIEDLRITLNQKIWTKFQHHSCGCLASDSESSGNGARGTQVR
uniref:Uncharacterized protein n=1 Tax=Oryza glumipatula TaxID=40148 RepID=A0A0D9ZU02_9ORYZ